ncbi:MAG: VanZ family protein, partial [Bacteroidetes bacterium]|nr:VanZ family protein [Bacteroidota bacterium]
RLLSELKVRHLANVFIIASVFVVLGTTLYPFDFTLDEFKERLDHFLNQDYRHVRGHRNDIITNIILFLPIGFSFSILSTRMKFSFLRGLFGVTVAGGLLSLTVELLQLFLPFRFSSILDIMANAAGSAFGYTGYVIISRTVYRTLTSAIERINKGHKVGWLAAMYLLYVLCLLLGSWPLQVSSFVAEFNLAYPLLVGNEPGGSCPWNGSINELVVANYPFSLQGVEEYLAGRELNANDRKDIVAHYTFEGAGPYHDKLNLNPPLEWHGKVSEAPDSEEHARIMPDRWLQTNEAASSLSYAIMRTLRYTVCFTVSSKDAKHQHIARMIAVASDPYRQNFSIVQIRDDLGIRFRSMTTGINGTNPQFMINGLFADTITHRIVVSVSPAQVRVFVDSIENAYAIELGPGFAMLNKFFPNNGKLSITSPMKNFHRVLFAVVVFVPLGYLLALLVSEIQRGVILRVLVACAGIAVPPYVLERMLCYMVGREISWANLAIGFALMFGTLLVTLSSKLYRMKSAASIKESR